MPDHELTPEPHDGTAPQTPCPRCRSTGWWPSRTWARVCYACHPDALEALEALAQTDIFATREVKVMVAQEGWRLRNTAQVR
jgi:hypothetical protein